MSLLWLLHPHLWCRLVEFLQCTQWGGHIPPASMAEGQRGCSMGQAGWIGARSHAWDLCLPGLPTTFCCLSTDPRSREVQKGCSSHCSLHPTTLLLAPGPDSLSCRILLSGVAFFGSSQDLNRLCSPARCEAHWFWFIIFQFCFEIFFSWWAFS